MDGRSFAVQSGGEPGFSGLALVYSGRGLSEVALVSTHLLCTFSFSVFAAYKSILYYHILYIMY